jgi:dienelactone hydrolase
MFDATAVLLRALGLAVPGGARVVVHDVDLGVLDEQERVTGAPAMLRARIWVPDRCGPGVLLPVGITPHGPADPRVVRLAAAIARSGRVVLVPHLQLSRRLLDPADVERLVASVQALHRHPRVSGGVSGFGFSFGGAYLLIAAADPRIAHRVDLIATFGAYAHLRHLLPSVREAGDPAAVRDRLDAAFHADGPWALSPGERDALEAVLLRGAPARELPASVVRRFDRLSPVSYAGQVEAPVVLLHAVDDPIIPYREVAALQAAFPDASVSGVELFTHVDFVPTPRRVAAAVRDVRELWRLASRLLAAGN